MNIFDSIFWDLKQIKNKISCFFFPRQKWLTKKIPKSWCDKTELVPLILFAVLVDFVESEMDIVCWEWADNHAAAKLEIMSCYRYIKEERPKLEKLMDDAYPPFSTRKLNDPNYTGKTYEEEYGEVNRLERLIDARDEETMITIVKIRHFLWT